MTDMLKLPESLAAWGTPDFIPTLKREITTLDTPRWVLAKRINGFGSIDVPVTAMVLAADSHDAVIGVRLALFYTVIETEYRCPDCSGDAVVHEACEMTVRIDTRTATATFSS